MTERFVQNKDVIQSKIGDEVVMLDIESGFYFGLNTVGSEIWSHLSEPITIDDLINKLMARFDIDQATCQKDTTEFINQLLEKNIIRKQS